MVCKKIYKKKKLTKFKIDINKQIKFLLTNLKSKDKVLFIEIFMYQI